MKTIIQSTVVVAAFGALVFFAVDLSAGDDVEPCTRKDFKTELVKKACTSGFDKEPAGTKAAQKSMQDFIKRAKKAKEEAGEKLSLTCTHCHSEIKKGSGYPLKPEGLKMFQDLQAFLDSKK